MASARITSFSVTSDGNGSSSRRRNQSSPEINPVSSQGSHFVDGDGVLNTDVYTALGGHTNPLKLPEGGIGVQHIQANSLYSMWLFAIFGPTWVRNKWSQELSTESDIVYQAITELDNLDPSQRIDMNRQDETVSLKYFPLTCRRDFARVRLFLFDCFLYLFMTSLAVFVVTSFFVSAHPLGNIYDGGKPEFSRTIAALGSAEILLWVGTSIVQNDPMFLTNVIMRSRFKITRCGGILNMEQKYWEARGFFCVLERTIRRTLEEVSESMASRSHTVRASTWIATAHLFQPDPRVRICQLWILYALFDHLTLNCVLCDLGQGGTE